MMSRLTIIALSALNLAGAALWTRTLYEKLHAIKWLAMSMVAALFGYLFSSAILLFLDRFTIAGALLLLLVALCAGLAVRWAGAARSGKAPLCPLDWDFRGQGIPVLLVVLALLLSWGNFGYFGMGQDQGVYQVKAIDLINGKTEKVYHFDEYDALDTAEEKDGFWHGVVGRLRGLDNISQTTAENQVALRLTGGAPDNAPADGIYHGIPTYPALLALFGAIAGIERMAGVQTLLFALTALALWYLAENLRLKKSVATLMCLIYLLSPEALWLSKSTLTESFLALIITVFLYMLSEPVRRDRRWWSAWMVTAFSVLHVTIMIMIPMFLALYFLMYLWSEDRQYLRAASIASVSFILGFTFMTIVAPRYTIRNTQVIWYGPIHLENVYFILMAAGCAGLLISIGLRWVRVGAKLRAFSDGKAFAWLFRILVLALLGFSAAMTLKRVLAGKSVEQAITTNGLYNMMWMTGFLFIPVIVVRAFAAPHKLFDDELGLGFAFVFGYTVLVMSCVLVQQIQYCYYYGRYLVPYIPVVCALAGMIWNRLSSRKVFAGMLIGAALSLPFDLALVTSLDDTVSSYDAVTRIAEASGGAGDAVVFDVIEGDPYDTGALYYLPVKALTGADCYFTDGDLEDQLARLGEKYDQVFYVTDMDTDYEVVTRLNEVFALDDNASHRLSFCPFPYAFPARTKNYTVYRYDGLLHFGADALWTTGEVTGEGELTLDAGQLQYGPYISLEAGAYRVEYEGENLQAARFWASSEKGGRVLQTVEVQQDEDGLAYQFQLNAYTQDVEFVVQSVGETPVVIRKIELKRLSR